MSAGPRRDGSSALPGEIAALIERTAAGLDPGEAGELRRDLEQHFRDGLRAGRSPEELLARFGDPDAMAPALRDAHAGRRGARWGGAGVFDVLGQDLRFAVRSWRRSPVVAAVSVLVLALGVGVTAVAFTVMNDLVLKPLPIVDPASVVDVKADVPGGNSFAGFSYPDVQALQESDALTGLAAFIGLRLSVGDGRSGERAVAQLVSPGYFEMLGVGADRGRAEFPPSAGFGADPYAVVSHAFWRTRLGSDPDAVGRTIVLQRRSLTVVGVASEGFTGTFIGFPVDVWLPLTMADPFVPGFDAEDPSQKIWEMIGRRRAGVTVAAADAALDAVAQRLELEYPELNRGHRVSVSPATGIDEGWRAGVLGFVAIVTLLALSVLAIACLNVGSILLSRATARAHEMTIRMAVGAGGRRLVRQLVTEVSVLVLAALGLGILAAYEASGWLSDYFTVATGGLGLPLQVDGRVLALTGACAVLATLVAGLAPAGNVLKKNAASVLRGASGERGGLRVRRVLVVGQVGLSVVLVTVTGLFGRALRDGLTADVGFDPDRVATFAVTLDEDRYSAEEGRDLQRRLVDLVAAVDGVEGAALTRSAPVGIAREPMILGIPGLEPPPGADGFVVDAKVVGAGYLAAIGVPLRAGRDFTVNDDEGGGGAAVVSAEFVDRWMPGSDPLGTSLVTPEGSAVVVGVAENTRYLLQDATPDPLVYLSMAGGYHPTAQLLVRGRRDPAELTAALQSAVDGLLPDQPLIVVRSARERMVDALTPQRLGALLVGVMGMLALVLAAVGLFGLVQFTVTRDTREIGIRRALGGEGRHVVAMVMGRGLGLVAVGVAVGLALAAALASSLGSMLIGASAADPLVYALVLATFAGVALLACAGPAVRALRIEPTEALRGE